MRYHLIITVVTFYVILAVSCTGAGESSVSTATPIPYDLQLSDYIRGLGDRYLSGIARQSYLDRYESVGMTYLIAAKLGNADISAESFTAFTSQHADDYGTVALDQVQRLVDSAAGTDIPDWITPVAFPSDEQDAEIACRLAHAAARSRYGGFTSRLLPDVKECPVLFAEYVAFGQEESDGYLSWIAGKFGVLVK